MEKKYERNTGLDVLRVIACFMVVFLHVSSRFFPPYPLIHSTGKSIRFMTRACAVPYLSL